MKTHNGCMQLFLIRDFDSDAPNGHSIECLIDVVKSATVDNPFPGLFCDQLPVNCFLMNKDKQLTVILNTAWRSRDTILMVPVNPTSSNECRDLSVDLGLFESKSSCHFLDACSDSASSRILFSYTNPSQPLQIGVYDINASSVVFSDDCWNMPVSCYRASDRPLAYLKDSITWKVFSNHSGCENISVNSSAVSR